ncbi:hypothetical protein, partial [Streptomyces cyaneofuscatus]|uniref:hypothetical protein n=1 Tax=Streptomyces cyaneofuscatus TaxID=66883 RepID=UPI0033AD5487
MSSPIRTSTPPISLVGGRRWNGDSQRDDRKRIRRWCDGEAAPSAVLLPLEAPAGTGDLAERARAALA